MGSPAARPRVPSHSKQPRLTGLRHRLLCCLDAEALTSGMRLRVWGGGVGGETMAREVGAHSWGPSRPGPPWVTEGAAPRSRGWRDRRAPRAWARSGQSCSRMRRGVYGHPRALAWRWRVLPTASATRSHGTPPQAFCVQVRGPHSSCFSSKPHVHLRSRGLWTPTCGHSPCPGKKGRPPRGTLPGKATPRGTRRTRHSTGSPGSAALEAVRPQMLDAVVMGAHQPMGKEGASGAGPRAASRGPRPRALSSRNSHVCNAAAGAGRGLPVSASYRRRKARGTASRWVVGGDESGRDSRSELAGDDSVFSRFHSGKAGTTQRRRHPQPNIVT